MPSRRIVIALALLSALAARAEAQLPVVTLSGITPPGGQIGTTVDVALSSISDGDGVERMLFSHPGITAKPVTHASPLHPGKSEITPNRFLVTIGGDVPPGQYDVRVVGTFGVSNPLTFAVDQWKEVVEPAGNQSAETAAKIVVPCVVNGAVAANSADWFRFAAKKGARVLIDVVGQRLDSRIDATLVVYDAAGRELARSRDVNRRDPLVDLAVPADGDYLVKLHDFTYGGGREYFYRLAVHQGPYLDFAYPPVVRVGAKNKLTLFGRNLPGGEPAEGFAVLGRPLEKLEVDLDVPADEPTDRRALPSFVDPAEAFIDGREYRLKSSAGKSNAVLLGYASEPIILEQEPNGGDDGKHNQQVALPCEIVGQFLRRGDLDCFAFTAKKGEAIAVEVTAQRMGFRTDPVVLLQQAQPSADNQIAWGDLKELDDDGRIAADMKLALVSNDSSYLFTAPADGTYRVIVRDLYGDSRADPRLIYRLSLRKPRPDFRLAALVNPMAGSKDINDGRKYKADGVVLRGGEIVMLNVLADRSDGFTGPITLAVEGLPAGVVAAPAVIAAGRETAPLSIFVPEKAATWQGSIRIVGRARIGDRDVTHQARAIVFTFPAAAANQLAEGRVAHDFPLAISGDEQLPISIALGAGKTPEQTRGGKLEIPVRVTRRGDFKDEVTLNAVGLPSNVKAATLKIPPSAAEGKLVVETNANSPLGEFTFYLATQAKFNYVRDKRGTDLAAERKQDAERIVGQFKTAAEAAKKAAAGAPKDQKAAADKTAAEAAAKLQAAEAALKAAQAQLDSKQKSSAAKSINNVPLTSNCLVVRIVEPPKAAAAQKPAK